MGRETTEPRSAPVLRGPRILLAQVFAGNTLEYFTLERGSAIIGATASRQVG
jgi:hypothetical protein